MGTTHQAPVTCPKCCYSTEVNKETKKQNKTKQKHEQKTWTKNVWSFTEEKFLSSKVTMYIHRITDFLQYLKKCIIKKGSTAVFLDLTSNIIFLNMDVTIALINIIRCNIWNCSLFHHVEGFSGKLCYFLRIIQIRWLEETTISDSSVLSLSHPQTQIS